MKAALKFFIALLVTLFSMNNVIAQISERGIPASFAFKNANVLRSSDVPVTVPIRFDVNRLLAEDKIAEANHVPLRTSVIIPVDMDVEKSGEWLVLPSGQQIWTLTVSAPDAIALMLYYDEFVIPERGKLFIYNESQSHIIGAYTSKSNPTNGAFATEFVAGDKLTLEYNAPFDAPAALLGEHVLSSKPEKPQIKISGIGYGYNYLKVTQNDDMLKIGESGSCMVNINCPEGADWQTQKKGVAKSVTPIGGSGFLCSGTLVNNTNQDLTPYFLTASHCFWSGTTTLTTLQWNQTMYYFHYESPGCATTAPTAVQRTITGSQMLVESRVSGGSDGVLLRLNNAIPLDWDLYFNGWDRRNIAASNGVGIHHPQGDVKKISTYSAPATSVQWSNPDGTGAANAHWQVIFVQTVNGHSVTEGGSSGSPLFNQNKLVVGTLTGGNSACGTNPSGVNKYGKLWYHWDANNQASSSTGANTTMRIRDYLDPSNTGAETLDGTYTVNNLPTADFTASSTSIYTLESITYTNTSIGATSYLWTFQGGTPATSTDRNPPPVAYNSSGNFTTTLQINGGTNPQEIKTENITVTIKGTPAQPVANFGVPEVVYSEGFDGSSTLAPNWVVETKTGHTSPNSWVTGNFGANFSEIDPANVRSAAVVFHANPSNAWLTSAGTFSIVAGSSIEFYAIHDGSLDAVTLNFLVSDDNGTNWTKLWTAGNSAISRAFSWSKYTVDLSSFAGSNLKIAWQYVGAGGNSMGLDGIKLYDPVSSTTLHVGDFLKPVDFSSGTPVLWDWTFSGATPVNATGEAPRVQYMTAGVYDISLTVTNTVGSDTKTITNAVTVLDKPTLTAFSSSSAGYTMRENYGQYIIPSTSVTFKDETKNYPLSWTWSFDGGTPTSANTQGLHTIHYGTAGSFSVSLTTSNTAGPQTTTIPGYVKSGYGDPTRIWNLMYGENITTYASGSSFVFGANTLGITMLSERFGAPLTNGYVSAVDLKVFKAASATGSLTIAVFTDNGGIPGTQIGSSATLAINSIPTSTSLTGVTYTTVTFPTPILVSGAFHIVVSGLPSTNTSGVRFASATSRGALAKNTAYLFYNSAWRPVSVAFPDLNTSLDIVPYFAYTANNDVDFDAEPGYILKSNNNLYIPLDGTLNFTDLSTGFPVNTWNWTFNGATPATSSQQNPQVVYTTAGTHDVSLSVINTLGGSGSITKTNFVRAENNVYNAHWNMLRGETGTAVYNWSPATKGIVSGPNILGITAYAERFDAPLISGRISAVEIQFYRVSASLSGILTISVAKDDNGFPGAIIASKDLAVNTTNFTANGVTTGNMKTITFDAPVLVSGAYHIIVSGYSGTDTGGVRELAICMAADRGAGKETFSYLDHGNWLNVADDLGLFTSLNIAPRFAYTNEMEASFTTEDKGYTRQVNYGKFIPTSEPIQFFDRTNGIPTTWNWTFTGGNPATHNVANPVISYDTAGEFAVKLEVENAAGVNGDVEILNYIKAGYNVPDRIWNLLPGNPGNLLLSAGAVGTITGANDYGDIAFAERFDEPVTAGVIDKVDIRFNATAAGTFDVSIRKEENGAPGQVLTSATLNASAINIAGYTTVTFGSPAYTDGAFYVVVSGFDAFASGTIGIFSSGALPESAKNTAFVLDATNTWLPVLESWGLDNSLSLNIVPDFTYIVPSFTMTGDLAVSRKDIDATLETVTITSSVPWTATTTASWLTINSISATEFEYSVADNTSTYPRAAKIVVAPTGLDKLQRVILIRQACTHPTGLTAAFDVNGDVQVDWNALVFNTPAPLPVSDNLKQTPVIKQLSDDIRLAGGLELSNVRLSTSKTMDVRSKARRAFTIEGEMEGKPSSGGKGVQESIITPAAKSTLRATPAETIVRWDAGVNFDAIGLNSGSNIKMEVGALFTPADLTTQLLPLGISKLTKVEFYLKELPLGSIQLKIRQNNITYQQEILKSNLQPNTFNVVSLNNPFILDGVSNTYIGYEFKVNGGMYVPGIDNRAAVVGKGDLIRIDGSPLNSLSTLTGGLISGNWNIAATIESGRFDSFVVYRNDVEIGRTATSTCLDQSTLTFGEHRYVVTAVYDDPVLGDLESTASNEASVFQLSPENSMFDITPTALAFVAAGEPLDVTRTENDPGGFISLLSLVFNVDVPSWIVSPYSFLVDTYTFTANPNSTGFIRQDTIQIWLGSSTSTPFSNDKGYKIPISQKSSLELSMLEFNLANVTYTGAAQPVNVALKAAYTGIGAITVLYNGLATVPVNAGTYTVSINALSGEQFEGVTGLTLGTLTITPAPLIIRPNDVSRLYGEPNPTLSVTYSTLRGADTPSSITGLTVTTTATATSMPGTYPITASGAVNSNYTISYEAGQLTVNRLNQTIYFPSIPNLYVGDLYNTNAVSTVGLAVAYSSANTAVAEISSSGVITAKAIGTTTITASNSGSAIYRDAQASCTLVVVERPVDPGVGTDWIDGEQEIIVYPNPVTKFTPVYVKVDLDETQLAGAVIIVFNESGALVTNVQVTAKLTKIDLSVNSGNYLFVLKGKQGIIKTMKIIVK